MRWFRLSFCAAASAAAAAGPSDEVTSLPTFGAPKTKQFAGYADATPDGKNKLFYYFVEAEVGSKSEDTPLLIWLNGGPGASSLIGMLAENLGPQRITVDGKLEANPFTVSKKYHLMAVDNPVGAGFSYTENGAYVKNEAEVRTQFVHAVRGFFEKHPEYKRNPLWMTGESYAGKYVPNIALEMAVNATEIPLQGVIIGNGLYNEPIQYSTVGQVAFGEGIIDENLFEEVREHEKECLEWIAAGRVTAGDYCENVTVRWLYTDKEAVAGQLFYYDFGLTDAAEFDTVTTNLGKYLNSPEVKAALHAGSSTWRNADEQGPVAEALRADFTIPSAPVVERLLDIGKEVFIYNGVRDGSVCNHIGNLEALLAMKWSGSEDFTAAKSVPWPTSDKVMGHVRTAKNLRYATVLRTGHLVPLVVPEAFGVMVDMAIGKKGTSTGEIII